MRSSRWPRIALTLAPLFSLAAQQAEPAFSLTVRAAPDVVRQGADVVLSIVATNRTQQRVPFPTDRYHPEGGFTINVTDPAGEPAGKTRLYRELTGDKGGKNAVEPPADPSHVAIVIGSLNGAGFLSPGEAFEQKVALNGKLFDLSKPGKYRVQVERTDNVSKTTVKSDIAEFTITN